jgi:hypothetical protein
MVHFSIFQGLFTAHFSQEEIAAEERRRDSFLRDAGRSADTRRSGGPRRSPAASPERWGDEGFSVSKQNRMGFSWWDMGMDQYLSIPFLGE